MYNIYAFIYKGAMMIFILYLETKELCNIHIE